MQKHIDITMTMILVWQGLGWHPFMLVLHSSRSKYQERRFSIKGSHAQSHALVPLDFYFHILLCFKYTVHSFYGQLFVATKATVSLRHDRTCTLCSPRLAGCKTNFGSLLNIIHLKYKMFEVIYKDIHICSYIGYTQYQCRFPEALTMGTNTMFNNDKTTRGPNSSRTSKDGI